MNDERMFKTNAMHGEKITIGIDLGINSDYCSAVLGIYYSDVYHLVYTTTDREQVEALNRILETESKKNMMVQAFKIIDSKNVDIIGIRMSKKVEDYNKFIYKNNYNRKELEYSEFCIIKDALEVC